LLLNHVDHVNEGAPCLALHKSVVPDTIIGVQSDFSSLLYCSVHVPCTPG
jgi:hypothetical protein